MVRLVSGSRLTVEELIAKVSRDLMVKKEGEVDSPLLVIDTVSSSLDLEDENDNSAFARAIDAIKTAFWKRLVASVWLIGHTSKVASRTDADATMRGASAIAGNSHMTATLVLDKDLPKSRFLVIGKIRGGKGAKEIEFIGEPFTENAVNRHGDSVQTRVIISTARPLGDGEREAGKDAERIPALQAEIVRIVDEARPCFMQKGPGNRAKPSEGYTKLIARDVVDAAIKSIDMKVSNELRKSLEGSFKDLVPPTSETEHFIIWD